MFIHFIVLLITSLALTQNPSYYGNPEFKFDRLLFINEYFKSNLTDIFNFLKDKTNKFDFSFTTSTRSFKMMEIDTQKILLLLDVAPNKLLDKMGNSVKALADMHSVSLRLFVIYNNDYKEVISLKFISDYNHELFQYFFVELTGFLGQFPAPDFRKEKFTNLCDIFTINGDLYNELFNTCLKVSKLYEKLQKTTSNNFLEVENLKGNLTTQNDFIHYTKEVRNLINYTYNNLTSFLTTLNKSGGADYLKTLVKNCDYIIQNEITSVMNEMVNYEVFAGVNEDYFEVDSMIMFNAYKLIMGDVLKTAQVVTVCSKLINETNINAEISQLKDIIRHMQDEIINKTMKDTRAVLSHPRLWEKIVKEYENTKIEKIDIDACGPDDESFANYIDSRFKTMFHYYQFRVIRFWYPVHGQTAHKCTVSNDEEWYEFVKPSVRSGSDTSTIFFAILTRTGENQKKCVDFYHGTCADSTFFEKDEHVEIACESPTAITVCPSLKNHTVKNSTPKKECPDATKVTRHTFCL